jgi:hypothetical protein
MLSLRRTTTTTTARWLRSYGCQRCASSFAIGSVDRTHDKKEDRLLIVGSGVAGSAAALIAAELHNIPVTLLFAGSAPTDCNSFWAQGGIIYRKYDESSKDGPDLLAEDIHRAGAGVCAMMRPYEKSRPKAPIECDNSSSMPSDSPMYHLIAKRTEICRCVWKPVMRHLGSYTKPIIRGVTSRNI